jgi:hypothetical protein
MSYASYQTATDGDQPNTSNHISPEDRAISVRQGLGVTTYSGGQAIEQDTYQNINTANMDPSGGLRARTSTGSPRQGSLQPTDVIQVQGYETTVQNAEALGLIEKDVSGRYVLTPDGPSRALADEATQQETQDDAQALPDASVEANLADLASVISPSTQVSVLQQLIANDGTLHPNTLARAAGESGLEPTILNDRIDTVVEGFQAQTDAMLKGMGAEDPSRFYEWCMEHREADLRKAMSQHAMERNTRGYQPLFNAYVETLAEHSPQDILNASFGSGIKAQMVDRQVVLEIPGHGRMTYRSAVKAGLITVKGV